MCFTYKTSFFFLQGEKKVISFKNIKVKINIDVQTHTNIGFQEKCYSLGSESSKSLILPSQELSENLTCKELDINYCQKESWSISNHRLVACDHCELDKLPELYAVINTTLFFTSSVSVAASSLKWTSSNWILLSASCLGKAATQLLHAFCRGNQQDGHQLFLVQPWSWTPFPDPVLCSLNMTRMVSMVLGTVICQRMVLSESTWFW